MVRFGTADAAAKPLAELAASIGSPLVDAFAAHAAAAQEADAARLGMRAPWLTSREHEVATLAADGLSSRAIAERLVVSPRTVESHLYRVFAKLGVSDRGQLAEVLGR